MVLVLPSMVFGYDFVDRSNRQHQTLVVDGVERNFYYEIPYDKAPPEGYNVIIGLHGAAMGYESWYREGTLMIILPNLRNPMDTQNTYLSVKWARENGYVIIMPGDIEDGVFWGVSDCENGMICDADRDFPADTHPVIVAVGPKDRVMPTELVLNLYRNLENSGVPTVRMGEDWPTLYPGHSYPLDMEDTFMNWMEDQYEILGM